jgi:PIN domain nuclease of toxin-antitoxin system
MRLLLDTHILIWDAFGSLAQDIRQYLDDEKNDLFFSPASIWEVVIKSALNKPDFQIDPVSFYQGLLSSGYEEVPITSLHSLQVEKLSHIHKDPFDRLLIAQAQAEGMTFLTADETIARYPGDIIFVKR